MVRVFISTSAALLVVACSHTPPPDFAPDPSLIAQIREIKIVPQESRACPGAPIHTDYEAILADGSSVPFARSYDNKQPPRLHVSFLKRQSPDAAAREDGNWVAERDPLATMSTGFRLTATLRANPRIMSSVVLPPTYDCSRRQFVFGGGAGLLGGDGSNGPDVTVRLDVRHSPFYVKLYVAAIEAGRARPVYVVGDSSAVGSADWLLVESRGGDGAAGVAGMNGIDGAPGIPGCPGGAGGQGQDGHDGGPGGDGGRGGRITIVVPPNQSGLARLVKSASWGGTGGSGGAGGTGGRGGSGGAGLFDANNKPCMNGSDGSPGHDGLAGRSGFPGASGPLTTVASAAAKEPD
jgi:hypothetical protein